MVERLGGETFLYTQLGDGEMLVIQADGEIPTRVHEQDRGQARPGHLPSVRWRRASRSSARSATRWPTCGGQRPQGQLRKTALYSI